MENTGRFPREVSADRGYYSDKNIEFLEKKGIEVFIPPDKVRPQRMADSKGNTWPNTLKYYAEIPEASETQDKARA